MNRVGARLVLVVLGTVLLVVTGCGQETAESTAVAAEILAESTASQGLPTPPLPYSLRQGKALFLHYCVTCHGVEGRGDGFNAYNLDPKPRDLGDPAFHQQRSDEDLVALIRAGGGALGLSSAMPPWGRTLSNRQIAQLVGYLRELPAIGESEAAPEEP